MFLQGGITAPAAAPAVPAVPSPSVGNQSDHRPAAPPPAPASETDGAPKKRTRTATGEMIDRINHAINAIINYNNSPGRLHDEKWAITINALKAFASSAPSILSILEQRKHEIEEHHQTHQIDPTKHNYVHRGKHKITQVIQIQD